MSVIEQGNILGFARTRRSDTIVTSAQVLALFATPITIAPAPGAGLVNIIESVLIHKPAGVAYAGIAAGEDLSVKYTNAAGLQIAIVETTGFLDDTGAQTRLARWDQSAAITPTANAVLVLHLLVGEIITGDSDLHVRVFYRIAKELI